MEKLVGLFSTTKVTTMKIHAADCPMVNTGRRRGFASKVSVCPADAFTVVDMRERGFGVSFCKCCPADAKAALLKAAEEHGPTGQS